MNTERESPIIMDFISEIETIRELEKRGGKVDHFSSYPEFNPQELTAEDMDVWNRIQDGSITRKYYEEYEAGILGDPPVASDEPGSREVFLRFVRDKLTPLFLMKSKDRQDARDRRKIVQEHLRRASFGQHKTRID